MEIHTETWKSKMKAGLLEQSRRKSLKSIAKGWGLGKWRSRQSTCCPKVKAWLQIPRAHIKPDIACNPSVPTASWEGKMGGSQDLLDQQAAGVAMKRSCCLQQSGRWGVNNRDCPLASVCAVAHACLHSHTHYIHTHAKRATPMRTLRTNTGSRCY